TTTTPIAAVTASSAFAPGSSSRRTRCCGGSRQRGSRGRDGRERLFARLSSVRMPPSDQLVVSGAREHNLKDVTVATPRNALVVITGLSGSGKSSLAFDTIYAEGQRRYVESLSAYARQFLGQM